MTYPSEELTQWQWLTSLQREVQLHASPILGIIRQYHALLSGLIPHLSQYKSLAASVDADAIGFGRKPTTDLVTDKTRLW